MSVQARDKIYVSAPQKKVRIGSRVPENSREWLKRHGIVAEYPLPAYAPLASDSEQPLKKTLVIAAAIIICCVPAVLFQQQKSLLNQVQTERSQVKTLATANQNLKKNVERLSVRNTVQQGEIGRMAAQLRGLTQSFNFQLNGLQKGEAMYAALQNIYDNEFERMSTQYDKEIELLRRQMSDKDQMISSLEASLQSADGVVVSADPIISANGTPNGKIAAINLDFQFVIIDIGQIKGLKEGQMAEFYHQGNLVGYGQIEKVYPEFAGVKVFSEEVLGHLQKGDAVFFNQNMNF